MQRKLLFLFKDSTQTCDEIACNSVKPLKRVVGNEEVSLKKSQLHLTRKKCAITFKSRVKVAETTRISTNSQSETVKIFR